MINFNVPTIACEVCAKTITNAIQHIDPQAEVHVNVITKIVEVKTTQHIDVIKQGIIEAGHTIND